MDADKARASVLITAEELQDLLAADTPVLLDVRWSLAEPDGHKFYVAGHIPGAQFVDLDADLAGPPTAAAGRHPLPSLDQLQAAARRWGIDEGDTVVVYDDSGGTAAARAWWLLRWGGLTDVRLLDGGLAAWSEIGGILEDGDVSVAPGNVTLREGHMPVADADEAGRVGAGRLAADQAVATGPDGDPAAAGEPADADEQKKGVLLDARAVERYSGAEEPVDARAGHIPGAVSAPTSENLDPAAKFRPARELQEKYARLGVGADADVVVYCGSGVTAAHEVAALESIGVRARLYPGSFSQWAADDARPVATGLQPPRPDTGGSESGGRASGTA
ncbi:sulfurtransferase [Ruania albidiflava]|uniref:sulfurtransferase n=1 Tax=Ruania albidiflava TaxID=366586 RepID=UPI0003B31207|nr:sulfurtransferase [Ruania albidiflava]